MTWTTDPDIREMVREHTEHEEKRMEWSREKDRVLAEKCEGWKRIEGNENSMRMPCGLGKSLPYYTEDLPAVVRAAEAWRKGGDRRNWVLYSGQSAEGFGERPMHAAVLVGHAQVKGTGEGPAALAHALYQAVTA